MEKIFACGCHFSRDKNDWCAVHEAAPELLDALEACKQFLDHGPEFPLHLLADAEDLQEQVRKVIAKVEGGE